MNKQELPLEICDNNIRIRVVNQKERQDPYELFNAMGCYMEAIQKFNTLVLHSVDPSIEYSFKFQKVEYSSIVSVVKEWSSHISNAFAGAVHATAIKEIEAVLKSNSEISTPKQIHDLSHTLEDQIRTNASIASDVHPYVDPVKLAEVLELITRGNELLYEGERVEVHEGSNVVSFNTGFRSKIRASKMGLTKKESYRGIDEVKVIRPCNFGRSQWEVKSTITGDTYCAHFDVKCDWLERYQSGKIPVVTAKHTLRIVVSYDKYIVDKKNIIKNAVISSVTVNTDPDGEQTTMNFSV
ncbi:hypothetical protein JG663_17640 [Vibrio cholerae]|uniref:hypothetical protein n=1 Tax=Vibrio cholerae TaxID=666 RepID=UPI0011D2F10F|nr:hypothetical protein [Vibrio cholerae]MBJ6881551.1 hypothetical protein [Vibrio cholerae]MBJ6885181.1 hypothetical protein [Vibrio cholerae]MBJ6892715.1 hypothetical protein [Vibrio cholerae]TXX86819.1 hypothetical protein FXF10_14020 [Vibrio cholerae]GHW17421.1 hypothetical protein VCSRO149_3465 [Vibrio cholerae]